MQTVNKTINSLIIKKLTSILLILLASSKLALAYENASNSENHHSDANHEGHESITQQFELSIITDYRRDNLNWNEASSTINIASELIWENMVIAQTGIEGKWRFIDDWFLYGKLDYGSISSGNNQDSDYNGNNRTLLFSRSNNQGGGFVRDLSIGLGKKIQLPYRLGTKSLSLSPLIGLSVHEQNLTMNSGFQTVPATGAYSNLNSTYDTQWQGPWVGIETIITITEHCFLSLTPEYHWAAYSAHANWNLRPEYQHPVSFTHKASGTGVSLHAKVNYQIVKNWHMSLTAARHEWHTESGTDQTFFSDGSVGLYVLNKVNWESTTIGISLRHDF